MGGIRKYERSVSRYYAIKNNMKANRKYKNEKEEKSKVKSGLKIFFEKLFGK